MTAQALFSIYFPQKTRTLMPLSTPGLLKIIVFQNKVYDAIISVVYVTNKILSHNSNYIVDVFMWPKFGNCSISMREFITTSIL